MLIQPWPVAQVEKARGKRDRVIHYQYRTDRARRTLRGIDEQVGQGREGRRGKVEVKRNRYVQLAGGTKNVNRELEAKTRALAGWKGYTTNLEDQPAEFVIGPTTSYGTSRRAAGCPNTTSRLGRPTTTSANRSRPT